MGLINEGKQLLFQPLTFLACILNCHIINFRWHFIVWLISVFWRRNKYIIVDNYWARWVKNTKDNAICPNKQEIKDAVANLIFNCYFTVGPKIFCQIIGIPTESDLAPFFANLFFYFLWKQVDERTKEEWPNHSKKTL